MKRLKSICILLMMALLSLPTLANEQQEGEALNIPEIVLHHLADAYESARFTSVWQTVRLSVHGT